MLFGEISFVYCWSILFIILILVFIKVRKKIRQRRWKAYNDGLSHTANDWKAREKFIDEFTGTTQKQRDERVGLEEEQNQLVYNALNRKK